MQEGFNTVAISNNLKLFKNNEFCQYFVGIEAYTAENIITIIKYEYDDDDDNISTKGKTMKLNFENVMNDSIREIGKINQKHLINFVDFVTGSRVLPLGILIRPNVYGDVNEFMTHEDLRLRREEFKTWPFYPLSKASTCFNTLNMPYLIPDNNNSNDSNKNSDSGNTLWSVENVSKNLLNVLCNGEYKTIEFHDG